MTHGLWFGGQFHVLDIKTCYILIFDNGLVCIEPIFIRFLSWTKHKIRFGGAAKDDLPMFIPNICIIC